MAHAWTHGRGQERWGQVSLAFCPFRDQTGSNVAARSHSRSDAIYHVASRGDRREPIFVVDEESSIPEFLGDLMHMSPPKGRDAVSSHKEQNGDKPTPDRRCARCARSTSRMLSEVAEITLGVPAKPGGARD